MEEIFSCVLCKRHTSGPVSSNVVSNTASKHKSSVMKTSFSIFYTFLCALIVLLCVPYSHGCNIDHTKPTRYTGTKGDYFGYTVLQHENPINKYILVGAPKAQSEFQPTVERPGGLWRCSVVSPLDCTEINIDDTGNQNSTGRIDHKDNQWLGVSLTRISTGVGVTVCGHRYANDFSVLDGSFSSQHDRMPNGICYTITGSLEYDTQKKVTRKDPCFGLMQVQSDDYRVFGSCQAGLSVTYTPGGDNLVFGAPGSYNWTGTTLTQDAPNVVPAPNSPLPTYTFAEGSKWNSDFSYVGYDVSSGNFYQTGQAQIVVGAPRAEQLGKVFLYSLDYSEIHQELYGEPMHTYFGSTVAAVDLNNDGYSDLLVGAPLYSSNQDEGKVYVYINKQTQAEPLELKFELYGSREIGGRFGSAISSAGDLNNDGFLDIIIGAPYENDHDGAIYIYRGNADGINTVYAQKMTGSQFSPPIKTFGSSVTGGMDIDGNTYHDITVGAYESDTVLTFKTKPLIHLEAELILDSSSIDPTIKNCDSQTRTCVEITICFNFTGLTITSDMEIEYSLTIDDDLRSQGINTRFTLGGDTKISHNGSVNVLKVNTKKCAPMLLAYLATNARDYLTPVPVTLIYDVKKYEVETEKRGDRPYKFPYGLPPVSDNYNCVPEVVTKNIQFVQECGDDGKCSTDLQLIASLELPAGRKEVLIIGAAQVLYAVAKINNIGEDAHQALLFVEHPTDFGYEGLELEEIICINADGTFKSDCTAEVLVICTPQLGDGVRAFVVCSLGNPMQSMSSATVRLRFDIGGVKFDKDRQPAFIFTISTISVETEQQKKNNKANKTFRLILEADLSIIGVSQPERVEYGYNGTEYEKAPEKVQAQKLKMAKEAVDRFYSFQDFNESWIGPSFTHVYQVSNLGPGELPLTSEVSIALPWRLPDGFWLIFIKSIELRGSQRSHKCNQNRILDLQRTRLLETYYGQSSDVTKAEEELANFATEVDPNQLGCSKAQCVNITCPVDILNNNENVVIEIRAILWQHTFITRQYSFVELISDASITVNDSSNIFSQPADHQPDTTKLITTASTGIMGTQPIKWWIILLAILIGLLLLALAIYGLYKFGFFKRELKDAAAAGASKKTADGGGDYAAAPTDE